jgi:hypothetical protein
MMSMSDRTDSISSELMALRDDDGKINPAAVVQWARKNKRSHLHAALTWDDEVAAERHRIWQVRSLIAVHIVDADGGRRFVSLTIDRAEGGYRALNEVMGRVDLRKQLLEDALNDLKRMEQRYKHLTELSEVWEATHRAGRRRAVQAVAELPAAG